MTEIRPLSSIELRYVLTFQLHQHGPATTAELVQMLAYWGFQTRGRPSKAVADCLRWEITAGRVYQRKRALYAPSGMPRTTEHRIRMRVLGLRDEFEEIAQLSRGAGHVSCHVCARDACAGCAGCAGWDESDGCDAA